MSDHDDRAAARALANPATRAVALERLSEGQLRDLATEVLGLLGHAERRDVALDALAREIPGCPGNLGGFVLSVEARCYAISQPLASQQRDGRGEWDVTHIALQPRRRERGQYQP